MEIHYETYGIPDDCEKKKTTVCTVSDYIILPAVAIQLHIQCKTTYQSKYRIGYYVAVAIYINQPAVYIMLLSLYNIASFYFVPARD